MKRKRSILDDQKQVLRIDPSDMLSRMAALPEQCLDGWGRGLAWQVPSRLRFSRQLLVLGMGGSAIGADLLKGFLERRIFKSISVNRTYSVPAWVGRETLVLLCSYSGNTEETLTAGREAARRGASLAAITSGGTLASWASQEGIPLLRIPSGWPPRSAIGYLTFAPLGFLVRLGWLTRKDLHVEEACASLKRFIASDLDPLIRRRSNPAKQIAAAVVGRLPVIYGASGGWEGITFRWRTQFEENGKTLAFHHLFPEATHNELSGWVQPKSLIRRMSVILLMDPGIHPRIQRRMEFTGEIIRRQGAHVLPVRVPGSSVFSRMLKMIALGDFSSAYLSLLYGVDPTPVERVEALKKFMAS